MEYRDNADPTVASVAAGVAADRDTPQPEQAAEHATELSFDIARQLSDVEDSWSLVYQRYTQNGLISENPYGLHCSPFAVQPRSLVVTGRLRGQVVSTLTAMHDTPAGLPLDSVYPRELDGLRGEGRRLMEVGLLADRRASLARFIAALQHLMRFPYYFGKHAQADILCGVHPHHAGFYQKQLGFEALGEVKAYASVNDHLVVLLRMNPLEVLARGAVPRMNAAFEARPLPGHAFEDRYRFTRKGLQGTSLDRYLRAVHGPRAYVAAPPEQDRPCPHDLAA